MISKRWDDTLEQIAVAHGLPVKKLRLVFQSVCMQPSQVAQLKAASRIRVERMRDSCVFEPYRRALGAAPDIAEVVTSSGFILEGLESQQDASLMQIAAAYAWEGRESMQPQHSRDFLSGIREDCAAFKQLVHDNGLVRLQRRKIDRDMEPLVREALKRADPGTQSWQVAHSPAWESARDYVRDRDEHKEAQQPPILQEVAEQPPCSTDDDAFQAYVNEADVDDNHHRAFVIEQQGDTVRLVLYGPATLLETDGRVMRLDGRRRLVVPRGLVAVDAVRSTKRNTLTVTLAPASPVKHAAGGDHPTRNHRGLLGGSRSSDDEPGGHHQ